MASGYTPEHLLILASTPDHIKAKIALAWDDCRKAQENGMIAGSFDEAQRASLDYFSLCSEWRSPKCDRYPPPYDYEQDGE